MKKKLFKLTVLVLFCFSIFFFNATAYAAWGSYNVTITKVGIDSDTFHVFTFEYDGSTYKKYNSGVNKDAMLAVALTAMANGTNVDAVFDDAALVGGTINKIALTDTPN